MSSLAPKLVEAMGYHVWDKDYDPPKNATFPCYVLQGTCLVVYPKDFYYCRPFDPESSADDRELVIEWLNRRDVVVQIGWPPKLPAYISIQLDFTSTRFPEFYDSCSHETLGTRFCELALKAIKTIKEREKTK